MQRSWLIFFAEDFILDSFLEVVIEFGNECFVVLFQVDTDSLEVGYIVGG
jgi:hypothetical protein